MVGEKIRTKRIKEGLSIADLAKYARADPSFINMVEQGVSSPSLATLRRIAAALQTPLCYFMGDDSNPSVIKSNQRQWIEIRETGVRHELLNPVLHRETDVFISHLPPGKKDPERTTSHPGEKCILVLRGSIQLHHGPECYEINAGESIYIDSTVPNNIESGIDGATIVTAVTPPIF